MKSPFLILRLYIFGVYAVLASGVKCGQSEYLSTAGECCPMCNIGSVVFRDCEGDSSTTCKPCYQGTFMNKPNGLHECFPCKTCDTGLSLSQNCSTIKNTVCEVLDGYYCLDLSDSECTFAVKHSECKPGEQIKTPGTKTRNTVCESCPSGFYSPEGVNCKKWTNCSISEITDQKGTSVSDVTCKPTRKRIYSLVLIMLAVCLVLVIFLSLKLRQPIKCRRQLANPIEETSPEKSRCAPSGSKEEKNKVDLPVENHQLKKKVPD